METLGNNIQNNLVKKYLEKLHSKKTALINNKPSQKVSLDNPVDIVDISEVNTKSKKNKNKALAIILLAGVAIAGSITLLLNTLLNIQSRRRG